MSAKHSHSSLVGKLGISLAGGVLFGAQALVLPLFAHAAAAEGKCGEGKCGTRRAAHTDTQPAPAEGKCGEGKCGAKRAAQHAGPAEGKCGEGKCGDASFSKTDSNHDGKVSRAEFLAVASERAADFDRIDTDHDGFISEREAHDFLKRTYEANGKPAPKGLFSRVAD